MATQQKNALAHLTRMKDIRPALPVKHNQLFMLISKSGDILGEREAQGIYYHDMRYLSQLELRLNGEFALSLLSDASAGSQSAYELTNAEMTLNDGRTLAKERISIRRKFSIDHNCVTQQLQIRNLDQQPVVFDLALTFGSDFTDLFVIRGHSPAEGGTHHQPRVEDGKRLVLSYDGPDKHHRTTTIALNPAPDVFDGGTTTWHITLEPRKSLDVTTKITVDDQGPPTPAEHFTQKPYIATNASDAHRMVSDVLMQRPHIETDNQFFNAALTRSFDDLRMLTTADHGDVYIAAGVPWYVALFGRDSLVSAFEIVAYQPSIAKTTLEVLASYQGTTFDDFRDEEPGKILHELRMGELANLHEIPQIPYYGTVDATPWFLLLLFEYVRWTGDIGLFHKLRENVLRALQWIDENPPRYKTEFLAYGSRSKGSLVNQGWKDSDNGIVNSDGSLARPPIQLVEVQGYVYGAKRGMAHLFRQSGDGQRADELERQADDLKRRFQTAFWMSEKQFYAMALEQGAKQVQAIGSNPGQALTFGIVDEEKASAVADRLLRDDMFCGWGIRTLSSDEVAYNPLDYQVGSVWPHDNALIALGLHRYGFTEPMHRVFTGIFEAATQFQHFRLPEVFDGFSRQQYAQPVLYPVACIPQAWAAGALPLLLQCCLGLEPDALNSTLHIRRPALPPFLNDVTVLGIAVGKGKASLHYQRDGDATLVALLDRQGELHVTIEY